MNDDSKEGLKIVTLPNAASHNPENVLARTMKKEKWNKRNGVRLEWHLLKDRLTSLVGRISVASSDDCRRMTPYGLIRPIIFRCAS